MSAARAPAAAPRCTCLKCAMAGLEEEFDGSAADLEKVADCGAQVRDVLLSSVGYVLLRATAKHGWDVASMGVMLGALHAALHPVGQMIFDTPEDEASTRALLHAQLDTAFDLAKELGRTQELLADVKGTA